MGRPRDIATVGTLRVLAGGWAGGCRRCADRPTWTEAAAALLTATGALVKAQRITDDEQRAALRRTRSVATPAPGEIA